MDGFETPFPCISFIKKEDPDYFGTISDVFPADRELLESHVKQKAHTAARKEYGCGDTFFVEGNLYRCMCCSDTHCDFTLTSRKPEIKEENNATNTTGADLSCIFVTSVDLNKCNCNICDVGVIELKNVEGHVRGEKHRNAEKKYGCDYVSLKGNLYYCTCCDSTLTSRKLASDHVKEENHRINANLPCISITLTNVNKYHCGICGIDIDNIVNLENHVKETQHTVSQTKHGCYYITLRQDDLYYCVCCDCTLRSRMIASDHIKEERHMNNADLLCISITHVEANKYQCKICDQEIFGKETMQQHVNGRKHVAAQQAYGCSYVSLKDYLYYCICCDSTFTSRKVASDHIKEGKHMNNADLPSISITHVEANKYQCKICDADVSGKTNTEGHVKGRKHVTAQRKYGCDNITLKDNLYYCGCCGYIFTSRTLASQHITEEKHMMVLNGSNKQDQSTGKKIPEKAESVEQNSAQSHILKENDAEEKRDEVSASASTSLLDIHIVNVNGNLNCVVCGCMIIEHTKVNDHVNENEHTTGLQKFRDNRISFEKDKYYCEYCSCSIPTYRHVYEHMKGMNHNRLREVIDQAKKPMYLKIEEFRDLEVNNQAAKLKDQNIQEYRDLEVNNQAEKPTDKNIEEFRDNQISFEEDKYYCKCCNYKTPSLKDVYVHIKGKQQNRLLEESNLKNELLTFSFTEFRDNQISIENNEYCCKCCNYKTRSLKNVYQHMKGRNHNRLLRVNNQPERPTDQNTEDFRELEVNNQAAKLKDQNIEEYRDLEVNNQAEKPTGPNIAEFMVIKGVSNVQQHLTGENHSYWVQQLSENITFKGGNRYYCKLCDCSPPGLENVYRHLRGSRHEQSLRDLKSRSQQTKKEKLSKPESLNDSNQSRSAINSNQSNKKTSSLPSDASFPKDHLQSLGNGEFHCRLCDEVGLDKSSIHEHLTSQRHQSNARSLSKNVSFTRGNQYRCKPCNCMIPGVENIYRHVNGVRHAKALGDLEKRDRANSRAEKNARTELPSVENASSSHDRNVEVSDSHPSSENCEDLAVGNQVAGFIKRLTDEISSMGNDKYHCGRCNWTIYDVENFLAHLSGDKHRSLMKTSDTPRELKSNLSYDGLNCGSRAAIRNQPNFAHRIVDFVGIFCSICYVRFASASELHSHLAIHVGEEFPSLVEPTKINGTINDSDSEQKRKNREDTVVSRSKKMKVSIPSSTSPNKISPAETPTETKINNFTSTNSEKFHTKVKGTINNSNSKPQRKNLIDTAVSRSKKTELAIPSSTSSKNISTAETPTASEIHPTSEPAQENLAPNAEEDRRSPSKSSVNRRILQLLNADSDQIHGMRDKLERAKLGMRLCAITESGNAYCLICRKDVASAPEKRLEHLDNVDHCEYLEGMEKDHALFELVPGQFSEFDLVSQYLEEVSNDLVRCRACDEDVGNADAALRRHINGENHARTREEMRQRAARDFQAIESRLRCDWYDVHRYWCVPCDEQFEAELDFARHLRSTGHAIVGRKSRNSQRGLGYDFCAPCGILWFGFRFTQAKHCESLGHRWAISKGNREARELPKTVVSRLREVERVVEDEMRILGQFYERARDEEELLRRDLELAAMDVFPGVKAFVCGSRASGLATGNNDLEISLDCDNLYDGKQTSEDEILHLMSSVHQWLDKRSRYWNVDEILSSTRSSVLKAIHIPTGLTCEVSFENGLAVENSKLIRYYTDIFPLCRELMLFLNKWLVLCDLAGPQGISRQALHWYLIFYLQKESTVPSVASLIARKNVSRRIAGWEVGVSTDFANGAAANSNSSNLREVLTRFFAFCEKFDHRRDVACPLLGREIAKRAFADPQSLPEEMAPYVEYTKNSAQPRPFRIDCVMCIQDPFDLKRNLADSVSKAQLSRFRAFCSKSLNILSS